MKVLVYIKRVPATEARLKVAGSGTEIDPEGLKYVVSPYDEYALELALRLREARGEGEVVVATLGEPAAAEQLRAALAVGADRAVLLRGVATMDGLATARALAPLVESERPALVLFGMKAVDDDQQQVGAFVAELVGLPCVTVVSEAEVRDGVVVCRREVEGGVEVVEAPLPAALTITKGPHEPRYASLKGIMAAKKKPLEEREAGAAGPGRIRVRALRPPPERPPGRIVGEGPEAVAELVRLLREEAKVL